MQWLERAYEVRDDHLILLPVDPKWNPCRGNARFVSLVDRCLSYRRTFRRSEAKLKEPAPYA
jgi:hypothetical protein